MEVEIRGYPARRVATVRHVGPYRDIGAAFARLAGLAGPAGLLSGGPMMGIYHDDPEVTPEDELRSDAALVVDEGASLPEGLTEVRIPAGRYAVTVHVGPYAGLPEVWSRLMGRWLPGSGHRVGEGVSLEIYRNTPGQVPDDELETELLVPVR